MIWNGSGGTDWAQAESYTNTVTDNYQRSRVSLISLWLAKVELDLVMADWGPQRIEPSGMEGGERKGLRREAPRRYYYFWLVHMRSD